MRMRQQDGINAWKLGDLEAGGRGAWQECAELRIEIGVSEKSMLTKTQEQCCVPDVRDLERPLIDSGPGDRTASIHSPA